VQALYDGMRGRGLTGRTVHVTHNVVRQAFAQAVGWQLLAVNPADAVVLPRWERPEMQALTAVQVHAFLAAAESDPLALYFHLAFATGIRPAELLGLRWQDLELDAGRVHVRAALERVRVQGGSEWRWTEPKAHSLRTIPLPSPLVERLRSHKATQAKEIMEHRRKKHLYRNHGLVFAGRFGEPFEARNVAKRHLKEILKAAELPESFRLYDTRHTCASLLAAAGEHPKVIAERLGHKDVTLTLNVYSHVAPGMQERATSKLGELLFGSLGSLS
jgi:integrase